MSYSIDAPWDIFPGLVRVDPTTDDQCADHTTKGCGCPVDADLYTRRRLSIIEAWKCEDRRERQSLTMKAVHAAGRSIHGTPEGRARWHAGVIEHSRQPEERARRSQVRTEYWRRWRLARVAQAE